MPPNPERRTQILDAAIDILCDDGVGGLTHRQVDSRARVPTGIEAAAQRTVDLHWQRVEMLNAHHRGRGFTPTPQRMGELSRLLNGFVFSNLTIAPDSGALDAAGLVDRLLSAFLD